jgi:hypothetical protein
VHASNRPQILNRTVFIQLDSEFNNGSGCDECETITENLTTDNWYHAVSVLDRGSNTLKVYLNSNVILNVTDTGVAMPNTPDLRHEQLRPMRVRTVERRYRPGKHLPASPER